MAIMPSLNYCLSGVSDHYSFHAFKYAPSLARKDAAFLVAEFGGHRRHCWLCTLPPSPFDATVYGAPNTTRKGVSPNTGTELTGHSVW